MRQRGGAQLLGVVLMALLRCAQSLHLASVRPLPALRRGGLQMLAARPADTPAAFVGLKVAELKEECLRRGLPVSGTKPQLLARLSSQLAPAPERKSARAPASANTKRRGAEAQGRTVVQADGPAVMVVESPAKCATIAKFAGERFTVLACNGHVRALPSRTDSVRPQEGFAMDFELVAGAPSVLRKLGTALRRARALYLATDPDREGEAIAWHVHEALRERGELPEHLPVHRISFSEITLNAVRAALDAPRRVNMPLVRAQQARQAVDYLVGFSLSPVLWRKLPGCRSAGRVQSVALRLIVEREHEVLRYVPREYWRVALELAPDGGPGARPRTPALRAELTHAGGAKLAQFDMASAEDVDAVVGALPARWCVSKVKRSDRQRAPPAPYNTASLQQDASRRLGLGVGRVMRLAQSLYEGVRLGGAEEPTALITYMRTDGVQMSAEGVAAARAHIASAYGSGEEWLPPTPREFKRKARNAQEAHEAIRPVDITRTPESLRGSLGETELRLYDLIWRRALGSQMANAVHEQLAVTLHDAADSEPAARGEAGATARASGSRLKRPGYRALYVDLNGAGPEGGDVDDADADGAGESPDGLDPVLAALTEGDVLGTQATVPSQHWTEPPPRFSEGSLVKRLEESGVGRPSTYASIMKSLQDRGYVSMVSKALRPQQRGELVTALLTSHQLETYVQTDFTARLEARLDAISAGELEHLDFLESWWREFNPAVQAVAEYDTRALRDEVAERVAWLLFPNEPPVPAAPPAAAQPSARPPSVAAAEALAQRPAPVLPSSAGNANGQPEPATNAAGEPPQPRRAERACPSCAVGQMELKFSNGWTTRPRDPTAPDGDALAEDKRVLGTWASDGAWSGLEVSVRDGPVGWYVQVGGNVTHEQLNLPPPPDVKGLKVAQLREELDGRGMETAGRKAELAARLLQADDLRPLVAHKRGSLPPGTSPSNVTMEMAERVLSLPLQLGDHPRRGGSMTLHLGRFGPYVSLQNAGEEEAKPTMASLPKAVSFWDVDVEQAATLIDLKLLRAEKKQAAKAEATTPKAKANKPKPRAKGTKRAAAKAKSKG